MMHTTLWCCSCVVDFFTVSLTFSNLIVVVMCLSVVVYPLCMWVYIVLCHSHEYNHLLLVQCIQEISYNTLCIWIFFVHLVFVYMHMFLACRSFRHFVISVIIVIIKCSVILHCPVCNFASVYQVHFNS